MKEYHIYRKAWRFDGAPHKETRLEKKDWRALLKEGGLMVRNTYDFDCPGETCFWHVIKDRFGGMEELTSKTYEDYAVSDRAMSTVVFEEYFNRFYTKDCDCWGIYDKEDGQLVGFQVNWLWDDACQYDLIGILPKYKRNQTFPYYGLFYTMNQYYLQEKGLKYVTDGSRSVSEHSNIQPFMMEKFNFRKAYCQLEIHYQWWMKATVNLLYPFRNIIPIPSIKAILNMEAMQRGRK